MRRGLETRMVKKKHLPKIWWEHFSESGNSKGKGSEGWASSAHLINMKGGVVTA